MTCRNFALTIGANQHVVNNSCLPIMQMNTIPANIRRRIYFLRSMLLPQQHLLPPVLQPLVDDKIQLDIVEFCNRLIRVLRGEAEDVVQDPEAAAEAAPQQSAQRMYAQAIEFQEAPAEDRRREAGNVMMQPGSSCEVFPCSVL